MKLGILNEKRCKSRIDTLDKKIEKLVKTNAALYEIIMQNNKLFNKFIENQLLHICNAKTIEFLFNISNICFTTGYPIVETND